MYNGSPYYQQYGQPPPPQTMMNYGAPMQPYPAQYQQHQTPAAPQHYHAPLQQHQPQPHNPALQIATDPNAFAAMFKSHLAALTFNSKPIITDLTLISHEHVTRMAHVVARCLEEHVLTCAPPVRLPALYAIDSICKNVGQPYTTLWSDRILRIFMETYRVVDQAVKARMEELLATWRNSGVNGSPLFGEVAQWNIERALFGDTGPSAPSSAPQAAVPSLPLSSSLRSPLVQPNHGSNSPRHQQQLQRTRTIERLNRLLAIGAHDQHHNPHLYDDGRAQALGKLRMLVSDTPLSVEEMNQIEAQLDSLEAEVDARRHTVPPLPLPSQQQQQYHHIPTTAPPSAPLPHSPRPSGGAANLPPSLAGALANLGKLGMTSNTPPARNTPPLPMVTGLSAGQAPGQGSSAIDLIASLQQAGLLPSQKSAAPPVALQQDLEYSNMIMSLNLRLTATDMQKELTLGSLEAITAHELPLQCRQCANRYPKGVKGQASMDQHLDWHFRQNRRAKDSAVRGQSRSWFSRLEEWIRGGYDDDAPASSHDTAGASSTTRSMTALTPAQEAELKEASKAFVIAPSDDPGVATKPCPICKELFKSEWSEEEEEWIWKDAIKVNGVYYHGSCHYSAKTLSASVKQTDSRESTPQIDDHTTIKIAGSRLTQIKEEERAATPVTATGAKRKAEGDDNDKKDEERLPSKQVKQET